MPSELLITVPAELVIIVSMLSVFRLQKTNQKNPPGLYYWHLLVFPCRISTYVTATCHPAASTIKPTKLFTPKVICDLLHHQIIACQSASSDSCCLCRLKRPERKICLFLHRLHQTVWASLLCFAAWEVTGCCVSSCVFLWRSNNVAFRRRCAHVPPLLWRSLNFALFWQCRSIKDV